MPCFWHAQSHDIHVISNFCHMISDMMYIMCQSCDFRFLITWSDVHVHVHTILWLMFGKMSCDSAHDVTFLLHYLRVSVKHNNYIIISFLYTYLWYTWQSCDVHMIQDEWEALQVVQHSDSLLHIEEQLMATHPLSKTLNWRKKIYNYVLTYNASIIR